MKHRNIVFILIDDMGWRDLQCFGSDFYETPNIDALAKEGMCFSQAYASCPVCSPSRASFLTGKYPARLGITHYIGGHDCGKLMEVPYVDHLPLEEFSLPKAFHEGGYKTWHVGKWHLGKEEYYPEKQGFDVNIGGCSWGRPNRGYFSPWHIETLQDGFPGDYLTDRITDDAIQLIQQNDDTPFFLFMSHYAVHTPIDVKPEDEARFTAKRNRMHLEGVDVFIEGENFPCEHKKQERVTRRILQSDVKYAAMIYNLDYNVGRLMNALKGKGIYEDTVIVFTSDNGGLSTAEGSHTCNAPLSEGKGWMYDGGIRVPMIVVSKNDVRPMSWCDTPVTTPDFYPTLLELAGLPLRPKQHKDGVSLVPLLKEEKELEREAIYWHFPHYGNQGGTPAAAVRCGDYKCILFFEDDHLELYNLAHDISESFDLAKQMPEKLAQLQKLLLTWIDEIGGIVPKKNLNYQG